MAERLGGVTSLTGAAPAGRGSFGSISSEITSRTSSPSHPFSGFARYNISRSPFSTEKNITVRLLSRESNTIRSNQKIDGFSIDFRGKSR